jgi:PAS domain-containing protein
MNPAVTSLQAERGKAVATKVVATLATLRTGVAAFAPDRMLLFSNPRFAELLGLPAERLQPGMGFGDLLKLMAARDEFSGQDGGAFIAAERDADRSGTGRFAIFAPVARSSMSVRTRCPMAVGQWR